MVIELIAKDKNKKLQYQGKCKLTIDSISKFLLVEPFNEDFKLICALFKWKFVAQKNILFIFGEHDFQDFALIFDNSNKCLKIYGILVKNGAIPGSTVLIKERFMLPLGIEFSINNAPCSKIKDIFVKWIEKHGGKEKHEFIELLKNCNVYDPLFPGKYGKRRREYDSIKKDRYIAMESSPPKKKKKLLRNDVSNKKILKPNFRLFYYTKKGIQKKTLIVFCPSNMKLCYEFYWSTRSQRFFCLECEKKRFVYAKICKNVNGEEYVEMNKNQHVCDLREFNPSKYRSDIVLQKSVYEIAESSASGKLMKYLFIFTSIEKKMCYKFTYSTNNHNFYCSKCQIRNLCILAHICKNKDGEEYISIQDKQHICEPVEYCPEISRIIVKPNFQLFNYTKRGIKKTTLIVFCSTNMKLCYEFYLNKQYQRYICLGCEKIGNVYAEICKDSNGEEYVQQNKSEHFCELRQFDPTRYQNDIVVQKSMFDVIESNAKYFIYGKEMKYLFIFTSTEKKMCYQFTYCNNHNYFYCSKCHIQKYHIRAHICNNETEEEEYVSIQDKQHICEPIEYCPEQFQNKIIKASDYQIMKRRFRGKWIQKLYIFTSKCKDLCYEYTWHEKEQNYTCNPCTNKFNTFVHARVLKNDDDEEYIKLGRKEHVCKPMKFKHEDSVIIKKPDYEIIKCINRGAEVTYLSVTHPVDKKCYKYTLKKKENKFICNPCKCVRTVVARLRKDENDEEFIELGKTEHICQSKEESSGPNIINH